VEQDQVALDAERQQFVQMALDGLEVGRLEPVVVELAA